MPPDQNLGQKTAVPSESPSDDATAIQPYSAATLAQRVKSVQVRFPELCTIAEAANILGVHRSSIKLYYQAEVVRTEEGIALYSRESLAKLRERKSRRNRSRIVLTGIDVERMQKICEVFYRTQLDFAERHLLALAKKVAKL